MTAVAFVQGSGASSFYSYSSGSAAQVLPGDVTPGDAVLLFPTNQDGAIVETVTSPIGEFLAVYEQQEHPSPFGYVWQCPIASGAFDQVTITDSPGFGGPVAALEFGPNAGIGQASAGYANLNGATNYVTGNSSATASATIENVTAGAAYVVVAYDRSGGFAIESVPGSPWTGLTSDVDAIGVGVAWLIAENTNPIPVSFEIGGGDAWTLVLVEILPIAGPSVSGVSPSAGVTGNSVTVTGTNFTGATAVDFGSTSATFTVVSAEEITCTAPQGTGTVDVQVTTPNGTSPTSSADLFQYTFAGPYSLAVSLSQAQATVTLS